VRWVLRLASEFIRQASIVASRVEIHEMASWLAPAGLGPALYARVVCNARGTNTAIWLSGLRGMDPIGPCVLRRPCSHGW